MHEAWRIYALLGAERRWVLATAVITLLASASGVVAVALTASGIGTLASARSLDAIRPIVVALAALIVARQPGLPGDEAAPRREESAILPPT